MSGETAFFTTTSVVPASPGADDFTSEMLPAAIRQPSGATAQLDTVVVALGRWINYEAKAHEEPREGIYGGVQVNCKALKLSTATNVHSEDPELADRSFRSEPELVL